MEKTLLLVNLHFPDNDQDNLLYAVPENRVEDARTAIRAGIEAWLENDAQPAAWDQLIIDELNRAKIEFEALEYDLEEIDCR